MICLVTSHSYHGFCDYANFYSELGKIAIFDLDLARSLMVI